MSGNQHLNYKKYGEKGRVIVILHGLFGMLDNWNTLAKRLSGKCQVYIVDQRNHGKSFHADEMSYDLMTEDLVNFLDVHDLTQVNLVGHSMGGKVAMNFALKYPEYLERLVVVDIAPVDYVPAHEAIFSALESVDFSENPTRKDIANKMKAYISQPAIIQFLMKNLRRNKDRKLQWKMNWPVIRQNYEAIIQWDVDAWQFDGEVLFIKGEKSNYIKEEDDVAISSYFPKAKILTIAQAGHWVHAEQPAAFLEALEQFFC